MAARLWAHTKHTDLKASLHRALKFVIPAGLEQEVYALSVTDWHDWLPIARPPYETTWVETEATYLTSENTGGLRKPSYEHPIRHGWEIVRYGLAGFADYTQEPMALGYLASSMEYVEEFRQQQPIGQWRHLKPEEGAAIAWGQPLVAKYGIPPIAMTVAHESAGYLNEIIGSVRMGFAALAYINTLRVTQPSGYTTARPCPTSVVNGKTTPKMDFHVVKLHREPTIVLEQGDGSTNGHGHSTPKREHDVRGHQRKYKSGKVVWVREHKRGDASLGRIEKEYVV